MKVIVTDRAKKDLSKLNQDIRERIFKALLKLQNGEHVDIKKLQGTIDEWRMRVGDYRVRLRIEEKEITIYALRVLHRREVYTKKA